MAQALPPDSLITYKFGHWCGSDRYVVATVFAQASERDPVLQSRVLLFDTRAPQEMWDLTDVIEALEGVPRGTWRAMFSACIEAS